MKKCCLCGKDFKEWGNNPAPLGDTAKVCCNKCNTSKVIPERLKRLVEKQNNKLTK